MHESCVARRVFARYFTGLHMPAARREATGLSLAARQVCRSSSALPESVAARSFGVWGLARFVVQTSYDADHGSRKAYWSDL
jgi:hypothetical protein